MLTVHHLDQSRSFRILWLLEELGLDYAVVGYAREAETRLAPPALEAAGGVGKAPMLEVDGRFLIESGAIIDHVVRRHGGGRLAPDPATDAYDDYQMWLHYAEGSAMLPVMLNLYTQRYGVESAAMRTRVADELRRHHGHIQRAVAGGGYLLADGFSAADVQMAMVAELLDAAVAPADRDGAVAAYVERLKARPAYARAVARGGDPTFRPRATAR